MKDIQQDVEVIRDSQIRMEQDLKYHIKRTDLLEEKVNKNTELLQPLVVWKWMRDNLRFILLIVGCIAAIVTWSIKNG